MNHPEKKPDDEYVEACRRIIMLQRQRIIELIRRKAVEERYMECFDFEVINETG